MLYRIATRQRPTSVATMLLAGIALGALAMALHRHADLHGRRPAVARPDLLVARLAGRRDLAARSAPSARSSCWRCAAAPFLARGLNALALGEATASHLGVPVQRLKYVAIVAVAAATGASVAVSGGIGFVGIVVPHLLRLADRAGQSLPAAGLGAARRQPAAAGRRVSRTIVAPAELPIGIVTAAVGAPFFLWILLRKRGILDL